MEMKAEDFFNVHTIQVEAITPTIIKSGDTLSPYLDYFVDAGKIFLIDINKVSDLLKDENRLKRFEIKVNDGALVDKTNLLKNFIDEESGQDIKDFIINESAVNFSSTDNPVQLEMFIRTGGLPYLPGSSIKGAFKTAILYKWMNEHNYGQKQLANYIDRNQRSGKKYLSENFEKYIVNNAFGKIDYVLRQPSSLLKISDSNSFKIDNLLISRFQKNQTILDEEKKSDTWKTVLYETLKPNHESITFQITIPQFGIDSQILKTRNNTIKTRFFLNQLQKDNKTGFLKNLFICANSFARHYVAFEQQRIKEKEGNESILDSLNKIETCLNSLKYNECLMNLGFGKSFFRNTVAMEVKKQYPEAFLNIMSKFYPKHDDLENFPSTYYLEENSKDMLGWIKLTEIK